MRIHSNKAWVSSMKRTSRGTRLAQTHHGSLPAPPLQPLVLPGGHARGLQLLPDHPLLRTVLHLLQPPQGVLAVHLSATGRGDGGEGRSEHRCRSEGQDAMRPPLTSPGTTNQPQRRSSRKSYGTSNVCGWGGVGKSSKWYEQGRVWPQTAAKMNTRTRSLSVKHH